MTTKWHGWLAKLLVTAALISMQDTALMAQSTDWVAPDQGSAPTGAEGSKARTSVTDGDGRTAASGEDDPIAQSFMDEFMRTAVDVEGRPGGEDAAQFPGAPGKPNWFQVLLVTRDENPMLEEECRQSAVQSSIDRLAQANGLEGDQEKLQAAAEHMQTHLDFIERGERDDGGISYSAYLKEVAECKSFCGPLVANLLQCHVLSVARLPHGIILFDLDSADVDPRYHEDEGVIAAVEQEMQERPDSKVLLIGRASRIGSLRYNRRLSAQRALAVKDLLMARGVPEERIATQWFGWEPPQVSEFVAREYGMQDLFRHRGGLRMNQSVAVVIY